MQQRVAAIASTLDLKKKAAPVSNALPSDRFQQVFRKKVVKELKEGKYNRQIRMWNFEVHPQLPFFGKKRTAGDWALKTIILWVPHIADVPVFCPFCPEDTPPWIPLPGQVNRYDDVPIKVYSVTDFMELVTARYKCFRCNKTFRAHHPKSMMRGAQEYASLFRYYIHESGKFGFDESLFHYIMSRPLDSPRVIAR
jgi:hypothetical protein